MMIYSKVFACYAGEVISRVFAGGGARRFRPKMTMMLGPTEEDGDLPGGSSRRSRRRRWRCLISSAEVHSSTE
ncbi:hypothetical protein Dimus_027211, partial [Dionaea muscipula]